MSPRRQLLWMSAAVFLAPASVALAQEQANTPTPPQLASDDEKRSIQIFNADGSPATEARVLVGDRNARWILIENQRFEFVPTGSMLPSNRNPKPVFLAVNEEGRIEAAATAPLLALGGDRGVGFMPSGSDAEALRLRQPGQVVVNLQSDSRPSGSYVLLAHWQPGYAYPTQPRELGYGQPDLHGMGWKFLPDFEMFLAAPMKPTGDPFSGAEFTLSGSLKVPPGEVRVTIVPADMLVPSEVPQESSVRDQQSAEFEIGEIGAAELRQLLLYHGPSRIISVDSGKRRVISMDACVHSLELKPSGTLQSLPEWGDSPEPSERPVLRLVREAEPPGDPEVIITPGSPAHESLLMKHQAERSQIPHVRIGRLTPHGTYRFDLLCPGTYRIEDRGQKHELVRQVSSPKHGGDNPFGGSNPFGGPADDSASTTHGVWEIEIDTDSSPNQFVIGANGEMTLIGPASGADAVVQPVRSPPTGPNSSREAQLEQLRARIQNLQQQLDAAVELVEELEEER